MISLHWTRSVPTAATVILLTILPGLDGRLTRSGSELFAQEKPVTVAATVEAAAKILDFRTLPLPENAVLSGDRQIGSLTYEIKADPKTAFQFQSQQLLKQGWKELPGAMTETAYSTGMFSKSGYALTIMSALVGQPDKDGVSFVSLHNFGNVALKSLPVVKGATSVFANEATAIYSTEASVADAVDGSRKLLLDAGWEPYGVNDFSPEQRFFAVRKNAIQISVMISMAPAQGNKTSIMYSSLLLAAEIPAPPNAEQLNFDGPQKTLRFGSLQDFQDVAEFYQQALPKNGWKSTTESLVTMDDQFNRPVATQVFRNAANDVITLNLEKSEEKTSAVVTHRTQQEVQDAEKIAKQEAAELLARREADSKQREMKKDAVDDSEPDAEALANALIADALKGVSGRQNKGSRKGNKSVKPAKDAVSINVPQGVKANQTSENVLQIKVGAGKGLKTAEFIVGHLKADGWETEDDDLDESSGSLSFTRDSHTISLTYIDTGFTDVTMMMIGVGTNLAAVETEAPAKALADAKPGRKPAAGIGKGRDDDPEMEDDADEKKKPTEPTRVEKPKKGISKMPKLSNAGSGRMGDKSFEFTQIIAYEVIANDAWHTKIVATSKPVKQEKLLALLREHGTDEDMEFPEPNVRIEVDEQDEVVGVNYVLDGVSGGGNSDLLGEVLIEDGRARGNLKPEKEGEFFERTYIWNVSFDTTVLTQDSKPVPRDSNQPKLENGGELTVGTTKWKLAHVVAYETKLFDDVVTKIFVSEKPIDMKKLKASLAKDGTDDGLFEFQPQVQLQVNDVDAVQQVSLWADNFSISTNEHLEGDAVIENGRARGTATLSEPGESFDKKYTFRVSFDVDVIRLPKTP